MSRLSHFLDNRRTDDGEAVSPMSRPRFIPQEDILIRLLEVEATPRP
jgi:hypothetical protein